MHKVSKTENTFNSLLVIDTEAWKRLLLGVKYTNLPLTLM